MMHQFVNPFLEPIPPEVRKDQKVQGQGRGRKGNGWWDGMVVEVLLNRTPAPKPLVAKTSTSIKGVWCLWIPCPCKFFPGMMTVSFHTSLRIFTNT
jgi:hypothetical protein